MNGNIAIISLVGVLLLQGGPPYVAGFVMTVCVDAVKTVKSTWPSSKTIEKFIKRREPKFNTSPAVFPVILVARTLTSVFSRAICSIFRTVTYKRPFAYLPIMLMASTRPTTAARQYITANDGALTAFTFTNPKVRIYSDIQFARISYDPQIPEGLTRQVDEAMMSGDALRGNVRNVILANSHGQPPLRLMYDEARCGI